MESDKMTTELIPNVRPNVSFDFSVNKQDIIDMVIAERTAEVEAEIVRLENQAEALKATRSSASKDLKKSAGLIAEKELKKLYALYGTPTNVRGDHGFNIGRDDDSSIQAVWETPELSITANVKMTLELRGRHKVFAAWNEAEENYESCEAALKAARRELEGLTKRGATAKAKIVRQLLSSTNEGKAILAQVAASGKALLGDGLSKKKK